MAPSGRGVGAWVLEDPVDFPGLIRGSALSFMTAVFLLESADVS